MPPKERPLTAQQRAFILQNYPLSKWSTFRCAQVPFVDAWREHKWLPADIASIITAVYLYAYRDEGLHLDIKKHLGAQTEVYTRALVAHADAYDALRLAGELATDLDIPLRSLLEVCDARGGNHSVVVGRTADYYKRLPPNESNKLKRTALAALDLAALRSTAGLTATDIGLAFQMSLGDITSATNAAPCEVSVDIAKRFFQFDLRTS